MVADLNPGAKPPAFFQVSPLSDDIYNPSEVQAKNRLFVCKKPVVPRRYSWVISNPGQGIRCHWAERGMKNPVKSRRQIQRMYFVE
jgi:hypothetical protein